MSAFCLVFRETSRVVLLKLHHYELTLCPRGERKQQLLDEGYG